MRYIIILFFLIMGILPSKAQHLPAVIDETNLQLKVKQIDEFMRRFNYDETYEGILPAEPGNKEERLRNMLTVFRIKNFTEQGQLNRTIHEFCNYVIEHNYRLEYEKSDWSAEVTCRAKMNGKPQTVSLELKTEKIRDVLYKWVLTDVSADFLGAKSNESKDSLFISPAEHGISFITLPRIINLSVTDVDTVFKKDWHPDNLSVFNYLISNKILVLSSVEKVSYHFRVGGYKFLVERFEGENTPNQGWLISYVEKQKQ